MRHRRQLSGLFALLAALLASVLVAGPAAAAGPSVEVIANGLDNPRGIDIGRHGRIYVAEAGRGGPNDGYGRTGRIIYIKDGIHTVVGRQPSIAAPEGEASGPVNVGIGGSGRVFFVIGGGPQDVNRRFDTLRRVVGDETRLVANIQRYRNAHPDPTDIDQPANPTDSNAYGLAVLSNSRQLVTDAAGNDLLLVRSGRVTTVAKFPNEVVSTAHLPPALGLPPMLPAEAVPTSVAVGPDGYWYVGELKGFPFTPGASRIWRVAPWARNVVCDPAATSGPCTVYADGFTAITGLDFGPDGSLYVVEIVKAGVFNLFAGGDTTGALIRYRNGTKTEIAAGSLQVAGDVAVSGNGTIYVTNKTVSVGGGEVLRIRP